MEPKLIELADQPDAVAEVSNKAKAVFALSPNRTLVVEGEYPWSTMMLAARRIVFKPGSRLIFDNTEGHAAGHFHIVADEIEVEDANNPGCITWFRQQPPAPEDRGQAATGAAGSGAGANGGDGAPGAPGATGLRGPSAPDLSLYVRTLINGGPIIDFRGGQGGHGGLGQQGGTGGAGAQGDAARQARQSGPFGITVWLPACESGPGQGGAGGAGGSGGAGGVGGVGGAGGNVTLASLPEHLPVLSQSIRVDLNGGPGGEGGAGNQGGNGGAGGPEGPLASFCNSAGRNGASGPQGAAGPKGENGSPGNAGQYFNAQLTNQQFRLLFGFE